MYVCPELAVSSLNVPMHTVCMSRSELHRELQNCPLCEMLSSSPMWRSFHLVCGSTVSVSTLKGDLVNVADLPDRVKANGNRPDRVIGIGSRPDRVNIKM